MCPRHRVKATHHEHGRAYCVGCFAEARQFAEWSESEMTIRRVQERLRGRR